MCRKAHGAAFATHGNVLRKDFRFTQGAGFVGTFRSSASISRTFCTRCGSQLQWFSDEKFVEWTSFALGTLDTPFTPRKQKHIYVASKASWYMITDHWPQEQND
jgi:hypothetical protein